MAQSWRSAVRRLVPLFFSSEEARAIEAKISADPDTQAAATSEKNPLKLAKRLTELLVSDRRAYMERDELNTIAWERELKLSRPEDRYFPECAPAESPSVILDMSDMLEWLPREDNLITLGRDGSARVFRIQASLDDIGVSDFSSFWASNRSRILASIPQEDLRQRATLESDKVKKAESYLWQQKFFSSLAKAISFARGIPVEIDVGVKGAEDAVHEGGYFVRIGDEWGSIEQKTSPASSDKIATARGQIVVLGNAFLRQMSRTVPLSSLRNEMFGFVGDGVRLQCVRQVHAYKCKVKAYYGRMLALATGDTNAGDEFTIDPNSEAVEWAAAALDRMIVSGARTLRAAAGVSNHRHLDDYGQLKLRATSGYCIGDQYLGLAAGGGSGDLMVTVLGAARNNDMCVVMRVLWNGEVWWLKMGPEAEVRQQALEALDDFSPAGAWERWFQAERDMLSRSVLGSPGAFAVAIEAARNRPAMLVRDAGDSLEKRLLEPAQVYEMSKQLCSALEAGCDKGVVHGDVCLENICEKDGSYSLIDWGLACGRAFEELAAAVGKAWPAVDVANYTPGIPNWEMSADCCFLGLRPSRAELDLESLLYCCLKLLGGNTLPWSQAAACGSEQEVLDVRAASLSSLVQAHGRYIYTPLLLRLGLLPTQT